MTNCQVCDATTTAFLCKPCTSEIERALGDLPSDLADLQAVATRQAAGPLGLGDPARQWDGPRADGALGDAPWTFAWAAADQLAVVANTLSTWTRHLCEARGLTPPVAVRGQWFDRSAVVIRANRAVQLRRWRVFAPASEQPFSALIGWLLTNLDSIRHDEAAAQIHDEITSLPIENRRWIMPPPPEEEFHGLCDAADVRVAVGVRLWIEANRMHIEHGVIRPSVGRCGTQLWSREKAQRIDCPACGMSYTRAERQASMLAELVDTLGTVRQVASTLTTLGRAVTVGQIDGWIRRGLILSRGGTPRMVRVGDVLDQRATPRKRGWTRRQVTAA